MNHDELADALYAARNRAASPPLPSNEIAGLDEAAAYSIQQAFVRRCSESDLITGFKAGAMGLPIQKSLGLAEPLTGVLLESGARRPGAAVPQDQFGRLLIETELGFVAGTAIDKPISGGELPSRFPSFGPAFELADVGFYGDQRSTGVDLIAANSASASYLCGRLFSTSEFDPDQQQLDLSFDGDPVYHASSGETLSGQWLALEWLVNSVIRKGYRIEPGQIFLTGALGPPQPGRPGKYQADYGQLGTVELKIV